MFHRDWRWQMWNLCHILKSNIQINYVRTQIFLLKKVLLKIPRVGSPASWRSGCGLTWTSANMHRVQQVALPISSDSISPARPPWSWTLIRRLSARWIHLCWEAVGPGIKGSFIETEMLSFGRNFRHCLHQKLTTSSKLQHSRFNADNAREQLVWHSNILVECVSITLRKDAIWNHLSEIFNTSMSLCTFWHRSYSKVFTCNKNCLKIVRTRLLL